MISNEIQQKIIKLNNLAVDELNNIVNDDKHVDLWNIRIKAYPFYENSITPYCNPNDYIINETEKLMMKHFKQASEMLKIIKTVLNENDASIDDYIIESSESYSEAYSDFNYISEEQKNKYTKDEMIIWKMFYDYVVFHIFLNIIKVFN